MPGEQAEKKNDAKFTPWLPAALLEEVKIRTVKDKRAANTVIIDAIRRSLRPSGKE